MSTEEVESVEETDEALTAERHVRDEIEEEEQRRKWKGTFAHGTVTGVRLEDSSRDWRDKCLRLTFTAPDGTEWETREFAVPVKRDGNFDINHLCDYTGVDATRLADLIGEEVPVVHMGHSWAVNTPKRPRMQRLMRWLVDVGIVEHAPPSLHLSLPVAALSVMGTVVSLMVWSLFSIDAALPLGVAPMVAIAVMNMFLMGMSPNTKYADELEE